jgi:tellurite resistance protein
MSETAAPSSPAPADPEPTTVYVEPETPDREPRLAHLPVTFFAVVMGVAGLALGWLRAGALLGAPAVVGTVLFWFALALDAAVLVAYGVKVVRHPAAVRSELHHPVRLAFVPTVTIALLLLATAGQEIAPELARALWWVGAVGQLGMTLYVVSAWIARPTFGSQHVNPAWFIPVVGLMVVPLAGVRYAAIDVSSFFFSVGLLFWLGMLPMVLSRLFVHEHPIPNQLLPTLAVLIAPPAIGFLSWLKLHGGALDVPARMLFDIAVFFALLFVAQVGRLRRIPFFLSWWAYSFPLAALSVATTVMAAEVGGVGLVAGAWTLLAAVSALVVMLLVRTSAAVARGRICVPE